MNLKEGYPYWLLKSGIPSNYPKLDHALKTDVLVIGGGISGALSAWFLAMSGVECAIVDARTIGMGSTSASTSLLQYELDKPLFELSKLIGEEKSIRVYKLCYEAIDMLNTISKKIDFHEIENRSSLYFAAGKKDVKMIESEYKARIKAGIKVELLDEKNIITKYNFSAPAAILSSQGATTNAYMLSHSLHKSAIKKGLKVFDRTRIISKKYNKTWVQLKTEQGYLIHAKKVIDATGYEVTEFIDKKIVRLESTYALASENIKTPNPVWETGAMLWNTAKPYLYMRLTNDNRVIVGGRDEDYYNPTKRDKLIKRKAKLLVKDFGKLFPNIELIPEYSWAGTFGSTKDSLPYIGKYNKTPHTYYALGFGGNGIVFSVIAAEIIRDMILGKPNKDISLFSFDR